MGSAGSQFQKESILLCQASEIYSIIVYGIEQPYDAGKEGRKANVKAKLTKL